MKTSCVIAIFLLFFCGWIPQKEKGEGYAEDFRILVTSLRELDPMAYNVMGKDTFDARAKVAEARVLGAKSRNEAMYIMQEFMYELGDAHATIASSYGNLNVERILPFKVYIIRDRLFIKYYFADTSLNGEEILAIDNVPAKDIIDSLRIFYPNDGRRDIIGFGLPALFNSLYGAFCHQADAFYVTTRDRMIRMPAVTKTDPEYGLLISYDWRSYGMLDPTYSKQVTADYGYFRFTDFAKEECGHNLEDELDGLITELNAKNIQNLVIDLRYNGGGDPYIAGRMAADFTNEPFHVFERLILTDTKKITYASYMVRNFAYRFRLSGTRKVGDHREKVKHERGLHNFYPSSTHFSGNVYVITGSMTGSSATMLCKYLMGLDNVQFVGSETEGSTNYFCAHKHCQLTLPNTAIYATFGMQMIELKKGSSDTEKPVGLVPANYIDYTIDDLLQSKDKEMEWIKNDIQSRPKQ